MTVNLGERKGSSFTASADLLLSSGTVIPAIGTPPTSGNWSTYTAEFTGSAANVGDTITIQLLESGVQGAFDNVHLRAIPEPSSMVLLGSGVLGLVHALRRKLL